MKSSVANEIAIELREDYQQSKARLLYLQSKNIESEEVLNLSRFVKSIDDMIKCFPVNQQKVIELCVLDDVPLTIVALEVGYHYSWVIHIRNNAMEKLEKIVNGDVVRGKLGKKLMEVLQNVTNENDSV